MRAQKPTSPSGHWYLHNSFCPLSPDELAAMAIDSNSHLFGKFIGGEGRVRGLNGRSNQPLTLTLSPSVRTQKNSGVESCFVRTDRERGQDV